MKNNIKVLSIILAFIALPFISKAQGTNTVTRNACISIPGSCCSNATVILRLAANGGAISPSAANSYEAATESFNYTPSYKKITVTVAGYTSTGTYYLPTVIGQSTIISLGADGEGVGPYTVQIYKNAEYQYTLSVGNCAH